MVKRLKELRVQHGLSQQNLAEMLGISQQAVFKYEKTSVQPDIETLIKLAGIFNVSVDYLIGNELPKSGKLSNDVPLSADEADHIRKLRSLPPDTRSHIMGLTDSISKK